VDVEEGVLICDRGGVTIGDGAVVGACSLVTRSIPPRALAYGVPAEIIRILEDEEKVDEEEASVETLEEALKLRSRGGTPVPAHMEGGELAKSSGSIYECPRRDRSQQHLGVRDSHGMTRAEILALVALAVSFMGCFFFVALLVVTKLDSDASLPRVRDL
jgi:hypothetical protein